MFSVNLRQLLSLRKMTQIDLANIADINIGVIRSYLNDDRIPNVVYAYRIAQALNTSVERLVTGRRPNKCETCYYSNLVKKLKSLSSDDYARVEDLVNRLCFDSAGGNQNDYDRNISCL